MNLKGHKLPPLEIVLSALSQSLKLLVTIRFLSYNHDNFTVYQKMM